MPNYLLVSEDDTIGISGDIVSVGPGYSARSSHAHPSWDDLRFPATAINPPGAASDPGVEATTGCLLFDAASTELIYAMAQMPHHWKEGSTISPHVHWTKTTSADGDVAWRIRYRIIGIGDVGPADWTDGGTVYTTVTGTPDNDTAWEHLLTEFTDIELTGQTLSSCILFEVARIGGATEDTYGADARLLEFDVHYQVDSLGSEQEYIK